MPTPRTNAAHDQNRIPTLIGVSTADGLTPVAVEVDPSTGQLQISSTGGLPSSLINGQQTVTTSAAALSSGALAQGVILSGLSTNVASVWIGGSGVATSTGYELQAGASVGIAAINTNVIYIISVNSSDKVSWIGS